MLPWIPSYESLGFCLQFQLLLPDKSGSCSLTVLRTFDDTQEEVWKLSGYHGHPWSFSQVSWTSGRNAKVEQYFLSLSSRNHKVFLVVLIANYTSWFLVGDLCRGAFDGWPC